MKLYIQVINGKVINHPIIEQNLTDIHQGHTEDMLLARGYALFNRISQPNNLIMPVGIFQLPVHSYQLVPDGKTWQDTWTVRDMTDLEKEDYIKSKNEHSKPIDVSKVILT